MQKLNMFILNWAIPKMPNGSNFLMTSGVNIQFFLFLVISKRYIQLTKKVHIQVDAKTIDFDIRFRTSTISSSSPSSFSSPKSTNAFAIRRSQYLNSSPRNTIESEKEHELTEDVDDASTPTGTQISKTKKRQLSDLCDELHQTAINEPVDDVPPAINDPVANVPIKSSTRGRKCGRKRE